jgi:hypothetical protein
MPFPPPLEGEEVGTYELENLSTWESEEQRCYRCCSAGGTEATMERRRKFLSAATRHFGSLRSPSSPN